MIDELHKQAVPAAFVHWVFNFLSSRPHCVRDVHAESPTQARRCSQSMFTFCELTIVVVFIHLKISGDAAILALFE